MPRSITGKEALLPNQTPAFHASHSTTGNSQFSSGYAVFDDVEYNIGSHYNSSNGVFTAPFHGIYFFDAMFLSNSGTRLFFHLRLNNTRFDGTSVETLSQSGNYATGNLAATLDLSKGDTIRIYLDSVAYGGFYDHFTGYLVR